MTEGTIQLSRLTRVAAAALLLVTAGCGLTTRQKIAAQEFGSATTAFAELTRAEFIQSRQDVIEMNRRRVLLGDATVQALDGHFTLDRTQARLHALDALGQYGQLLQELLATSSAAELQSSADALASSLNHVEGIRLSPAETEALGKAVTFGGGFLVEAKRARAMKNVIGVAHPHVLKTIDLVERDFDPTNDFWTAGYRRAQLDLEGAAQDQPAGVLNDPSAAQFVRGARRLAKENRLRFEQASTNIVATAKQLRKAESNLSAAMTSKDITIEDVEQYRAQVEDLKTLLQLLRSSQ